LTKTPRISISRQFLSLNSGTGLNFGLSDLKTHAWVAHRVTNDFGGDTMLNLSITLSGIKLIHLRGGVIYPVRSCRIPLLLKLFPILAQSNCGWDCRNEPYWLCQSQIRHLLISHMTSLISVFSSPLFAQFRWFISRDPLIDWSGSAEVVACTQRFE
jgi:hypothetical protein